MFRKLFIGISNWCLKRAGISDKHQKNFVFLTEFNLHPDKIMKVELYFENGSMQTVFVSICDIRSFLLSCRELYYQPGINPYTTEETTKLVNIKIYNSRFEGPHWYTTPCLMEESGLGATTIEFVLRWEINPKNLDRDAANWSRLRVKEARVAV